MRRKSDRTKDKEKGSPEKKTEKATRRSRRHSKRRRRSSSPSEHEDSVEENDTSMKSSVCDKDDDQKDKVITVNKDDIEQDSKEKNTDEDSVKSVSGRTRRSSKKQTAEVAAVTKPGDAQADDDWKEDKSFWEGDENKTEADSRHKEKEGKSSVWQVKSSNDGGSSGSGGGEIQKIKLCIVRPPETSEPSPRRRKRLSRSSSSHKDKTDAQESDEDHEEEEKKISEISEEKQNTQEEEIKKHRRTSQDKGRPLSKPNCSKEELEEKQIENENVQPCDEMVPSSEEQSKEQNKVEDLSVDQDVDTDKPKLEKIVDDDKSHEQVSETVKESEVESVDVVKDITSDEKSETKNVDRADSDETVQESKNIPKDVEVGHKEVTDSETEQTSVLPEVQQSCNSPKEPVEQVLTEEKQKSRETSEESSEETIKRDVSSEETIKRDVSSEETIKRNVSSEETIKRNISSEETIKRDVSSEEIIKTDASSEEKVVISESPERESISHPMEEGQVQDSSEENSTSQDVSKSESKVKVARRKSVSSHREKLNRQSSSKHVYMKDRSLSHDSSEERSREVKRRRQRRDSNSSGSFRHSPSKQSHHSRLQDGEHLDKHKRRDSNRSSSSERQESKRSSRRSHSPQQRKEKISLRRSFSQKSESEKGGNNSGKKMTDDASPHIKEDKENLSKSAHSSGTGAESSQSMTRRRRWGASKISRTGKKQVLSISTDSLKNLIPGAKPVPISEVQLSPEVERNRRERDPEDLEGEDSDREKPRIKDRERDTQEATADKFAGPTVSEPHKISVAVTDDRGKAVSRKISIVSDDARTLQNSPSPPRHKYSNILFITNLVRPFTVNQLKELLARTGTITEGGFWIDKIKSKCYVQYESETEARETRHALHGVRWPVSNPKTLCVDFGKKEDMDLAQALSEEDQIPRKTEPLKVERTVEGWVAEQVREKEREREMRERERERERTRGKERLHHVVPPIEAVERSRNMKMSANVREWDLGKVGQLSPNEREPRHEEKNKERERRIRREKVHHSRSPSPHDMPARKQKKKDDDAPAKLLDDLFRKTKSTPCIYWLPLTAEQIVVKEEMRRRHMAEHERRMAEMRKAERDRERARAQQRQQRRTGERDKRRRRTTSISPKK